MLFNTWQGTAFVYVTSVQQLGAAWIWEKWMNIFDATLRVSKMMEQKYGCSVEFYYYSQIQNQEIDKAVFETIERNLGAQFVIAQGKILMPIYIDGDLFGSIVVKEGSQIHPENFEEVHLFLDTTLKDFIVKKESLRRLKIEEACLKAQISETNIVPILKNRMIADSKDFESESNYRSALFLTGGDYTNVREIALDIHSMLKRSSFVPYSVLDFNSPIFSENMPELGRITIFIPEILDLSKKEIQQIFEYIHNFSSQQNPFLIISSQRSVADIEKENLLEPEQIDHLKKFHLMLANSSGIKDFYNILLRDRDSASH